MQKNIILAFCVLLGCLCLFDRPKNDPGPYFVNLQHNFSFIWSHPSHEHSRRYNIGNSIFTHFFTVVLLCHLLLVTIGVQYFWSLLMTKHNLSPDQHNTHVCPSVPLGFSFSRFWSAARPRSCLKCSCLAWWSWPSARQKYAHRYVVLSTDDWLQIPLTHHYHSLLWNCLNRRI